MEKVVYALWRDPRVAAEDFCDRLRGPLASELVSLGALGVQVNVADGAARGAAPSFETCHPPMEGFIWLWLHSANAVFRQPLEDAIASAGGRMAGYLVTESRPMCNTRFPSRPGERTEGFSQVALFEKPPRLRYRAWLDIWLNSHTQIAIDTQDTFYYVQNVVTRRLTFDAPPYNAIVEEGFPPKVFGDIQAFYDAAGDEARYREHERLMQESCQRFIDFDRLDVVQTSQYVISTPG